MRQQGPPRCLSGQCGGPLGGHLPEARGGGDGAWGKAVIANQCGIAGIAVSPGATARKAGQLHPKATQAGTVGDSTADSGTTVTCRTATGR